MTGDRAELDQHPMGAYARTSYNSAAGPCPTAKYGTDGKIGRIASEEVIFALIKSKCLPILLYGSDSCPTNAAVKHSFEFTLNGVLFKIFGLLPKDSYRDICKYFVADLIEKLISVHQSKFISR